MRISFCGAASNSDKAKKEREIEVAARCGERNQTSRPDSVLRNEEQFLDRRMEFSLGTG